MIIEISRKKEEISDDGYRERGWAAGELLGNGGVDI